MPGNPGQLFEDRAAAAVQNLVGVVGGCEQGARMLEALLFLFQRHIFIGVSLAASSSCS